MENKELEVQAEEVIQPLIAREVGLISEDDIRKADKAVVGLNKIKSISLKLTNKADWAIFNKKPCLQNSGCMKIAGLWGVSFISPSIVEERKTDERGEYIIYTCSGIAEFRKRTVEDIGTSSTRDSLLGTVNGALRPLADVDLQDVKKMSVTNWQSRILKKILGLAFTMEDLEQAGIKLTGGVSYAEGGGGGGLISEAQGKRLYAISKTAKVSEETLKATCKAFGYDHSKDIKKSDYEAICKAIEDKGKALSSFEGQGDAQE